METGNLQIQSVVVGSCLVLGIICWVGIANDSQAEPPKPVHSISSEQIPVLTIEDDSRFSAEKFRMIQLGDGHDYWVFRDKSSDRGYAGMAHSPECQKCVRARERLVDRL